MPLRYNRVLKLLAILLFSFELLAPAYFVSTANSPEEKNDQHHLTSRSHSFDLLSHLIFEETCSEEEREGKEHALTTLFYTEVFSELQKFEPARVNWLLPREKFDTQPALFTLHRVLLI